MDVDFLITCIAIFLTFKLDFNLRYLSKFEPIVWYFSKYLNCPVIMNDDIVDICKISLIYSNH